MRLSDLSSSFRKRATTIGRKAISQKFFVLNETMWQRVALTVFPLFDDEASSSSLCICVCARSATSIASFSVSICPFEIDDLSSDQAKGKTTANSRARLRLLLYKFWFELFGGRSSSVFKNIRGRRRRRRFGQARKHH